MMDEAKVVKGEGGIPDEASGSTRNEEIDDDKQLEFGLGNNSGKQDVYEGSCVPLPEFETILTENETKIHTIGGHKYSGSISSGVLQGLGHFEWCDEIIYDGDFLSGRITGTGKYKWPNGSTYEGEVYNGLRCGHGYFIVDNQRTAYNGQWKSGKRNGKGKLVYNLEDQSCYYEGHWVDNMKNGCGTMQYSSGNIYDGEWRNNKQHGVGTMHWFERGEVYTGEWVNGLQHGVGTHLWTFKSSDPSQYPLRNWYEGDWVKGRKHGHGIFHYSSGSSYEGTWKADKKQGQGYYTSNNGLKFHCFFVDDKIQYASENTISYKIVSEDIKRLESKEDFMVTTKELSCASPSIKISSLESSHLQALLLRNISELRQTYVFYSSLGTEVYSDRVSVMNGLQLAAFLQDVNIQQYGLTIFDMECFLGDDSNSFAVIHDPSRYVLMKDFNRAVLLLATKSQGLPSNHVDTFVRAVLASATNIQGLVFSRRKELTFEFLNFKSQLWKTYLNIINKESVPVIAKFRDIWTLFKKSTLCTTQQFEKKNFSEVLKLITGGDMDGLNLEVKLSFLEFFDVVLKFTSVTIPLSESSSVTQWHHHLEHICDALWTAVTDKHAS